MKSALVLALAASLAFAQTAKDPKKPAAPVKAEAAKPEPAKTAVKPGDPKPVAGGIVANKDSKTYHKADCKAAAKIKDANKTSFASKAEAEKAGFKACKTCKP
ncbi:MAG: hypothetical protein HY823_10405 [Acidobacteria bacterium]|nr:hypothetical protein [Acidobacteriota bacterium]